MSEIHGLVSPTLLAAVLVPAARGQLCPAETKLPASDGVSGDYLGYSVAVSGTIAVAGAPLDDEEGVDVGAVHVHDLATGVQIAKLVRSDAAPNQGFGTRVAISGSIVVAGVENDDDNGPASGSAYVFDAATGQELAKLLPADGAANDQFGRGVAISGSVAIVGAHEDDDNGPDSGSAYLFDVTTGQQLAKLLPSDGAASDLFGSSVAISGVTALVGAPASDDNGVDSGSAYVFDVATGQQLAKLLPSDGAASDQFGASVAISGTTALVGAPWDDVLTDSGTAYLFDVVSGQQIARLVPVDVGPADLFGSSVAVSGSLALVGSYQDDNVNGGNAGSVYVFDAVTGAALAKLLATDGAASDWFGFGVAVDGTTAIVGAWGDDDSGLSSGSVYSYELQTAPETYCTAKPDSLSCGAAIGAWGTPSVTDPGAFAVFAAPVINNRNGLLFYGTAGRAAIPLSGGTLCVQPPLRRTGIQSSSGTPPAAVDCSGLFVFDFNAWAQSGTDPALVAGQQVDAQYWWRDPDQPDGTGVALTDALEFALCP